MANKKNNHQKRNIQLITILFLIFSTSVILSAQEWIYLNGTGEVRVNDANNLDGFSKATWNMWINQKEYNTNAGIAGKYQAITGARSYLIKTALTNGSSVSLVFSPDGANIGTYTSDSARKCGVRINDEWTMITITYDGSLITYYRNGVKCDTDTTTISSLYNSTSPLRLGGGNSVYFKGGIDEYTFYNQSLSQGQIARIFNESIYGTDLGDSIPVLVYHEIRTPANDPIFVTPENFAAQMAYLNQNGFTTVTLKNYFDWRNGDFTMPKKAIILIFDDGFSTVYNNAKPIMDQYGFVGTIASVTRYASFTGNNTGYMKWGEINDLSNHGWSIESHSITHSHMLKLNESQFRIELLNSRDMITNKTGKKPSSFIFPFHESNSTYTHICGEYYELCWTQGSPSPTYDFISTNGKEYLSLRRINVENKTTMEDFVNFLGRDTNKFGEWEMEEGNGTTTTDSSGNQNTGNLLNGAFWFSGNQNILLSTVPALRTVANTEDMLVTSTNTLISSTNKKKDKSIDGIENIIDTDKGKPAMKLEKEKKKWEDNVNIEGQYYSKRKNLTDPNFYNKLGK